MSNPRDQELPKQIDAVFKVRWELLGGHVHCALFVAPRPGATFAKSGTLCVRAEEFVALQTAMRFVEFEKKAEMP